MTRSREKMTKVICATLPARIKPARIKNVLLASAAAVASMAIMAFTPAAVAQEAAPAPAIMIDNAQLHTMAGPGVIANGDIIIQDGKIAAIGQNLSAPAGARVIDAKGRAVTPGLIAPYTSIGLVEIGLDRESNDEGPSGDSDFASGAALDAADAFNPNSSVIGVARAGGVTRALAAPAAGSGIFAGQAAVADMSGEAQSLFRPRAGQVLMMGYGGAARAGDTRMGAWVLLRDMIAEARAYAANPRDFYRRTRDERFVFSDLAALRTVVSGETPLFVHADSETDIRNLLRFKRDNNLKMVLVGGSEAWRVADALAASGVPVILNPLYNLPGQFEDLSATLAGAGRLEAAGVTVSFFDPGFAPHNAPALTQLAGNAAANGMTKEGALAALTLNAAEILGVEESLGSLSVGKIADLVVWDGDPLEVTSRADLVFINGREVSLDNRQSKLRARYQDLSRGELPHAYRGGSGQNAPK